MALWKHHRRETISRVLQMKVFERTMKMSFFCFCFEECTKTKENSEEIMCSSLFYYRELFLHIMTEIFFEKKF